MGREPLGDPLKIVRVHYRLDPDEPPGAETGPMRLCWRGTVVNFPDVGSAGVYVHKPDSQHCVVGEVGNAGDWTAAIDANTDAKLIAYLWRVFDWQRQQGIRFDESNGRDGLPFSELIFRDVIATQAHGWTKRAHTGTFHATHVHSSAFPLRAECA